MWRDGDELKESHFRMCEFENRDGFVMVDDSVLRSLELVRRDLGAQYGHAVRIMITSGTRTIADNERLGKVLGWTDAGGAVARNSRHLAKYGGVAVDIVASHMVNFAWVSIPQERLASTCRDHFAYVKADYRDGHVHADNREA